MSTPNSEHIKPASSSSFSDNNFYQSNNNNTYYGHQRANSSDSHNRPNFTNSNFQGIASTSPTINSEGGFFSKITKYFVPVSTNTTTSTTINSSSSSSNNSTYSQSPPTPTNLKQLQKRQKKFNNTTQALPGTITKVKGGNGVLPQVLSEQIGVFPTLNTTNSSSSMDNNNRNSFDITKRNSSSTTSSTNNSTPNSPYPNSSGSSGGMNNNITVAKSGEVVVPVSGNTIGVIGRNTGIPTSNYLSDDEGVSESKLERFNQLLNSPEDIDLEELRKLSWRGIPSGVRATIWKLLLGYMPCNKERSDKILLRKRKEYLDYVSKYYNEEQLQKTEYENAIQKQIHMDVLRTNPDLQLFQNHRIQQALERILYIWSIRHPASGYVQGINDLVTPFMIVFLHDLTKCDIFTCDPDKIPEDVFETMECDSFWCVTQFIDFIQDHYTFAQPGIQRMVNKLEEIIQKIDEPLFKHLQSNNLDFIQFAFRWMNCLLMREMSLKLIIRIFDAYISEGDDFENLHVYVCAAFLKFWSEKLRSMEFTEMVLFLQHLPTRSWSYVEIEMLLSQAYMLKVLYDGNNHLN
ncbi:hypothetical protein ABK040_003671 [Willaertia magna]